MGNVIDLEERKRRMHTHLMAEEGASVVAIECADGMRRVGILVPSDHDGIALSPAEARSMAVELIECAAAIEGRCWIDEGKDG